jgi:hypothetical protein
MAASKIKPEKEPLFSRGDRVLIGSQSGSEHLGLYFVPGKVIRCAGIMDIVDASLQHFTGRTHYYQVKRNERGSEEEICYQHLLALDPLDLSYVSNGLMDRDIANFYRKGAKVLAYVHPCYENLGEGKTPIFHTAPCFLPGSITEQLDPNSAILTGYRLSSQGSLVTLLRSPPRLFRVSLDGGGSVFQLQHMMTPDPHHKISRRFYSDTLPKIRARCKK